MKMHPKVLPCLPAALLTAGVLAGSAGAAIVVGIHEVGGDVVASFQGSIDLTGLTHQNNDIPVNVPGFLGIDPSEAHFGIGGSAQFDPFGAPSDAGPSLLGPGIAFAAPDLSTGDFFGNGGSWITWDVWVPAGYVSGDPISGTSTWLGTTIADLGLTPDRSYTYTLENDSITLNIGPTVPEPSSGWLLLSAVAGVFSRRRRRRDG